MEEIEVKNQLLQQDLFELFKIQLRKDFETSGLDADFVDTLPSAFELLKEVIIYQLKRILKNSYSSLSNLLYRIDVSELQIKKYQGLHKTLSFEEIVAELIIKRVLQKIILKKRFSH